ncbi:UvrD-helicase domain-containing protein [Exiguobacterium sp. CinTr1]|uniref:UvrD-helicase domain-containing protein n=1 Tax=Exiguobacterium sp. CinTr1 TaxID=2995315 RepID=UPI0022E992DF|nr:UvrD-helicase domain-containing protein [Exiguobacterium sp. CinTr1]
MGWIQSIQRFFVLRRVLPKLKQEVNVLQIGLNNLKQQLSVWESSKTLIASGEVLLEKERFHHVYERSERGFLLDETMHTKLKQEDGSLPSSVVSLNTAYTSISSELLNVWHELDERVERINQRLRTYYEQMETFHQDIKAARRHYIGNSLRKRLLGDYRGAYDFFKDDSVPEATSFIQLYRGLDRQVEVWNETYVIEELNRTQYFFDSIDGKSLDAQQRRAVIVNEDANLVVAGAGSGKTLTIAAKVKYLVERKQVQPHEILLISFTKKSAEEMKERICERLHIPVEVKTFHGLGMGIIAEGRKQKPQVEDELKKVIRDYCMHQFYEHPHRMKELIDFFGYYFYIPKGIEEFETAGEYHDYNKHVDLEPLRSKVWKSLSAAEMIATQHRQKITIQEEKVKSLEEVMIANFLFLNGIEYEYEKNYPYQTATRYHRQYQPDFYLPEYDLYLEHFGINRNNRAPWLSPIEEQKYLDGMEWKRQLHREHGTKLVETYSYYRQEGNLLEQLRLKLLKQGVVFREVDPKVVFEKLYRTKQKSHFNDFVDFVSSFLQLFKSNHYTESQFDVFAQSLNKKDLFHYQRALLFFRLVKPMYRMYEDHLRRMNKIDFNDMINEATSIVSSDAVHLPYKYIIIDEYQDISVSRYRLIEVIRKKTGSTVMCVGDDWQSIYRFAGSDLSLFTDFEHYFGKSALLKIENTYRNSQQLIDIAGRFVMKNKRQIRKNLSSGKRLTTPVRVMGIKGKNDFEIALRRALDQIVQSHGPESDVLLVGRNNFDIKSIEGSASFRVKHLKDEVQVTDRTHPNLRISFLTAHRSKGLEAENVILINTANSKNGFPNKIMDDPLLSFVLQKQEELEFGEERRLFYVALTRTKHTTYVLTPDDRMSTFVQELIKEQQVPYEMGIEESKSIRDNPKCPRCLDGHLVIREQANRKSTFVGCSHYPGCDYTANHPSIIHDPIVCPSCRGYLVLRDGKNGKFYGCLNFPLCKHTMEREDVEQMKRVGKRMN